MPSMKYDIPIKSAKFWMFDEHGNGTYTMTAKFKKGQEPVVPNDPKKAREILAPKIRAWTSHEGKVVMEYKDLYGSPPTSHMFDTKTGVI